MKKISLIIAFVLISIVSVSAQTVDRKEIKNRDIEWSDFIGNVDESSKFDAYTYWVITYAFPPPKFNDNTARVKVTTRIFLRSDSWVKPNKQNPLLLNHERGHFKIGRLCAKEFEETVNSTDFDPTDYAKQIDTIYWETIKKYIELEKRYDADTEHFKNQTQQAIWDKKLNEALSR